MKIYNLILIKKNPLNELFFKKDELLNKSAIENFITFFLKLIKTIKMYNITITTFLEFGKYVLRFGMY